MKYTIEKGIPIPERNAAKQKSELRQALEKLEVGDSILLNAIEDHPERTMGFCQSIRTESKTKRFSFRSNKGENGKIQSYRVWRTA